MAKLGLQQYLHEGPKINSDHPRFLLKNARINKTTNPERVILLTSQFRKALNQILYKKFKKEAIKKLSKKSDMQKFIYSTDKVHSLSKKIFFTKDFRLEYAKNAIFKRVHARYFMKDKAVGKTGDEIDQAEKYQNKWRYFRDRYAGITDLHCTLCSTEDESESHIFAGTCIETKQLRMELVQKVRKIIAKAIWHKRHQDEQGWKSAIFKGLDEKTKKWKIPKRDRPPKLFKDSEEWKLKKEKEKREIIDIMENEVIGFKCWFNDSGISNYEVIFWTKLKKAVSVLSA